MPVPQLDPEQRRAALEKAARARTVRAELKQMVKSGEVTVSEVIERAATSDLLAKMRVVELLESMPSFGKTKAHNLMERLGISANRRLGGLGPKQRAALAAEFDGQD